MAGKLRHVLFPAFEWFWNSWASARHHLIFIVCGSATSWMGSHFADIKGGLFNRHTCRIYLEPFSLAETEAFLKAKRIRGSRYEIAQCHMILGGILYYPNQLRASYSFRQNTDLLFFKKHGVLWDEFDYLYRTLFSNSELYIKYRRDFERETWRNDKGGNH